MLVRKLSYKSEKISTPLATRAMNAHASTVASQARVAVTRGLIDLLHLGGLVVVLLERRQLLDVLRLVVVLDGPSTA